MPNYGPTTREILNAFIDTAKTAGEATLTNYIIGFNRWLAEERAAAVEEAAMNIDFDFEVFTASDGFPSIRQHGKSPSVLLIEYAKHIREEAQ